MENQGLIPLQIIEVQNGDYVEEDDIDSAEYVRDLRMKEGKRINQGKNSMLISTVQF